MSEIPVAQAVVLMEVLLHSQVLGGDVVALLGVVYQNQGDVKEEEEVHLLVEMARLVGQLMGKNDREDWVDMSQMEKRGMFLDSPKTPERFEQDIGTGILEMTKVVAAI